MATPHKFSVILMGGFPWKRTPVPQEALSFGETSVLERTIAAYREAEARSIVVVLGPNDAHLERAAAPVRSIATITNVEDTHRGMGIYFRRGLQLLDEQGGVIAVGLTDMPLLTGKLITQLFEQFRESGKPIGVPVCQGILGHPVFFVPELRRELERISSPGAYRDIILQMPDEVAVVPTEFTAVLRTIDGIPEYREMLGVAGLEVPEMRKPRKAESEAPQAETAHSGATGVGAEQGGAAQGDAAEPESEGAVEAPPSVT